MNGWIDEARIWSTVRSQQQIQDNMHKSVATPQSNLEAYWPIQTGETTNLQDISGNNHTVVLPPGNNYGSYTNDGGSTAPLSGDYYYRYGFNGQEKSDEISGLGNHNTALFWEYDTRLGRRWNRDPKIFVGVSEYVVLENNPNLYVDPNGDFRTRFGAKLHKFLHGGEGGEITKNRRGQYGYNKSTGNTMENVETAFIKSWGAVQKSSNNVESVNAAAKWLDGENEFYQSQRGIAYATYKTNMIAEASNDKPFISFTGAITHGHYGLGGDLLGSELGVKMDNFSIDLIGLRDNQLMAMGKAYSGDDKGKKIKNVGVECEFLQAGFALQRSFTDGKPNAWQYKVKGGPVSVSGTQQLGGGTLGFGIAGFHAGIGLVGIDLSVDLNLNARSQPIVVPPPPTGLTVPESTRPRNIYVSIPTKK